MKRFLTGSRRLAEINIGNPGELLTHIHLPAQVANEQATYFRSMRKDP
jgi:CO/xanthine dehydrogenase FAD-binding subunit